MSIGGKWLPMGDFNMSQKTTVATVGIVIFLLLLSIGSAYAGYTVTSRTVVDENSVYEDYITLSINASENSATYTNLLGDVAFNSINDGGNITYELQTTGNINYNGVQTAVADITGTDRTISVAKTTSVSASTFGLSVTVNAFTPVSGVTYIMSVGTAYAEYVAGNNSQDGGWTFTDLAFGTPLPVKLYVCAPTAISASAMDSDSTLGFTNGTSNFTFTATATEVEGS